MHQNSKQREEFQNWLDSSLGSSNIQQLEKTLVHNGRLVQLKSLLGHLWNCTDILPAEYCNQLEVSRGSTYAQAVRKLFQELSKK